MPRDMQIVADNIKTLLAHNAPDSDIDAYVREEGYDPATFTEQYNATKSVSPQPSVQPTAKDAIKDAIMKMFSKNPMPETPPQPISPVASSPMSVSGFMGNVGKDLPVAATNLAVGTPLMAGQGVKTVGELAKDILTGNYRNAGQGIQDLQKSAIQSEPAVAQAIQHPIQTVYEKPVQTAIATAPTVLGLGGKFAGVAGKFASDVGESSAAELINTLIKPKTRNFVYGKNPGRGVAKEGIIATSFEDLSNKIGVKLNEIGEQITNMVKPIKQKLDISSALEPIDNAIAKANEMPRTNLALIKRLEKVKHDMIEGMNYNFTDVSAEEALNLKRRMGSITKFTGAPSDDELVNKALKQSYGKIDSVLDKNIPESQSLNERYADLLGAKVATDNREFIQQRNNVFSLPELMTLFTGIAMGKPLEGVGAALAYKGLSTTPSKTLMAAGLNNIVSPVSRTVARSANTMGNKLLPYSPFSVASQIGNKNKDLLDQLMNRWSKRR